MNGVGGTARVVAGLPRLVIALGGRGSAILIQRVAPDQGAAGHRAQRQDPIAAIDAGAIGIDRASATGQGGSPDGSRGAQAVCLWVGNQQAAGGIAVAWHQDMSVIASIPQGQVAVRVCHVIHELGAVIDAGDGDGDDGEVAIGILIVPGHQAEPVGHWSGFLAGQGIGGAARVIVILMGFVIVSCGRGVAGLIQFIHPEHITPCNILESEDAVGGRLLEVTC